jgi:hypothetical protein
MSDLSFSHRHDAKKSLFECAPFLRLIWFQTRAESSKENIAQRQEEVYIAAVINMAYKVVVFEKAKPAEPLDETVCRMTRHIVNVNEHHTHHRDGRDQANHEEDILRDQLAGSIFAKS